MSWGETLDQQKSALRWDIKRSLNNLCKKLADIGEECFVVTVNVSNSWVGHMGSVRGNEYINQKPFIAYDFLDYCRDLDESGMVFDDNKDNRDAVSGEEESHSDNKENSDHDSTDTGDDDTEGGSPRITVSRYRDSDDSTDDPTEKPIEAADIERHKEQRKTRLLKMTTKKIINNARQQIFKAYSKSQSKPPGDISSKSSLAEKIGGPVTNITTTKSVTPNKVIRVSTVSLPSGYPNLVSPSNVANRSIETRSMSQLQTTTSTTTSDTTTTTTSDTNTSKTSDTTFTTTSDSTTLMTSDTTSDPPSSSTSSSLPGARVVSSKEGGPIRLFCWTCEMSLPNRSSFIDHIKWRVHMFKCQAKLQCFKCFAQFENSPDMYSHMKECDLMTSVTRLMETDCLPPSGKVIATKTVTKPDGSEMVLRVTREDNGNQRLSANT